MNCCWSAYIPTHTHTHTRTQSHTMRLILAALYQHHNKYRLICYSFVVVSFVCSNFVLDLICNQIHQAYQMSSNTLPHGINSMPAVSPRNTSIPHPLPHHIGKNHGKLLSSRLLLLSLFDEISGMNKKKQIKIQNSKFKIYQN